MARVLISMPENFLDQIDEIAEKENRSRSELIRQALRTYIKKQQISHRDYREKNAAILDVLLD